MYVQACSAYDTATATCTAQAWVYLPSILPPLTVAEALQISGACAVLWGTCLGLRFAARLIWRDS